jgi:hypothetical protein
MIAVAKRPSLLLLELNHSYLFGLRIPIEIGSLARWAPARQIRRAGSDARRRRRVIPCDPWWEMPDAVQGCTAGSIVPVASVFIPDIGMCFRPRTVQAQDSALPELTE